jgi:ABC-type uncharacterized transport system fused permease/ATPase subunit
MCRLFFHQPHVVVLDEATSAVPYEIQEKCEKKNKFFFNFLKVYEKCLKIPNMIFVSVAHRLEILKYHKNLLQHDKNSSSQWKFFGNKISVN